MIVNSILEGDLGILLPNVEVVETEDGVMRTYVYLGVLGSVIVAAAVGHFMGSDPKSAFSMGVAAPFVIESIIEKIRGA